MPEAGPHLQAFAEALLWPGLGSTLAAALPGAAVTTPDDVTTRRLQALPGVSPMRAERLVASFAAAAPAYEVAGLLLDAGLPVRLAASAVRALGTEAPDVLRRDPWRLLDAAQATLRDADVLARTLVPGAAPDDPRRGAALVAHLLQRAAKEGSTCLPLPELARGLADAGWADAEAALRASDDGDRVALTDDGAAALVRYAVAEDAVAEGVARLLATAEPLAEAAAVGAVGKHLDEAQQRAVAVAMESGVSVLTGGPGTGKSRTVAALVKLAQARGKSVALAAPTGRAAKRLEELCGSPATTLHRLLGAVGTTGSFTRGEQWPLDEQVVVVDEASMLDTELAAALVEAVPDGAHLLLVGDPAQLPSIGAGRVLGDLVDSGAAAGHRAGDAVPLGRRREHRPAGHRRARGRAAAGRGPVARGRRRRGALGRGGGAPDRPARHRLDPAGARHPGGRGAGGDAGAPRAGRHAGPQHRAQGAAEPG